MKAVKIRGRRVCEAVTGTDILAQFKQAVAQVVTRRRSEEISGQIRDPYPAGRRRSPYRPVQTDPSCITQPMARPSQVGAPANPDGGAASAVEAVTAALVAYQSGRVRNRFAPGCG